MISPGPYGQSVLTTGSPQRIASTIVMPNGSKSDDAAPIAPLTHSASIGVAVPIRKTLSHSRVPR